MSEADPIALLFGGMAKLGPGSDAETLRLLRSLPRRDFGVVVDAGCGAGRQTLVLAKELGTPVDAVDAHAPFLAELERRAATAGLAHLVRTHAMDMKEIPSAFPRVDLLWSEGAAYNIGFADALAAWAPITRPHGFVVVSELCWLREDAPEAARSFFRMGYPQMKSLAENRALAERAGFRVLEAHTLPREAWVDDYYDVLGPRAKALVDHPSAAVRDFAAETLAEIRVFECAEDSYGYVAFVLRHP